MAVVQTGLTGLILFLNYYYLLRTIGVQQLGIWSVVLSTTTVLNVGQLGFAGSVVKFVAQYVARDEPQRAGSVVETAVPSIACLIGVLLGAVYPLLHWVLGHVVPAESLASALALLPYALFSLWLTAISGVFLSGLDGCQRIDLRGLIIIGCTTLYLMFLVALVPKYGLLGVAYAQVLQASALLLAAWMTLRRELLSLAILPVRWNPVLFREMFAYSINFQVNAVMEMLFDPIAKGMMSKFGGLAMVGYFEMANRMVLQFRSLVISALQVLVPVVAGLQETAPSRIDSVYQNSCRLLLYLILPLYAFIVAMLPIVSDLWVGSYEPVFVKFALFLSLGWFLNSLNAPAYFANLGTGRLRWNTLSYVTMGISNVFLGLLLGGLYGGFGVLTAYVLSLVSGSSIVLLAYHYEQRIPLTQLLPRENNLLALSAVVGSIWAWWCYFVMAGSYNMFATIFVSVAGFALLVVPFLWTNPIREKITEGLRGTSRTSGFW